MGIYELHTLSVNIRKEWSYEKSKYASGEIIEHKFVETNIETEGLVLQEKGVWDPYQDYGKEEADEYYSDYIQEGLRNSYAFENYTGYGFYGPESDPITDAVEAKESGDDKTAYKILTRLLEEYPECIDALAHLGNMYFDGEYNLEQSHHCYRTAVYIAEKKLPENFDGIILWARLENRPYLRALHGLCLTNWRLKKFSEANSIAKKMLRLNPPDNQGIRFIIDEIKDHKEWHEDI